MSQLSIAEEVARRRTFAIISHPDAGKTTLTEKILLFAGAIQIAGSVKARKASRHAASDWMEIEKQRGISVASSVMQMEYEGCVLNLLDTPGHQDFSEDTYRVLTAVDAALMVIDAANGIESQTIRLLEVCRARNTPIITFINKLDREVQQPLDVLAEVESHLGMDAVPFSWPVGMGRSFGGVFDIPNDRMRLFKSGQARRGADADDFIEGLDNPAIKARFPDTYAQAREEINLLKEASPAFDRQAFLEARQTPVFLDLPSITSAFKRCWTPWCVTRQAPVRDRRLNERSSLTNLNSPVWCLRSKPTWIHRTGTVWRLCGLARVDLPAACD